jgi:hypothetical protein
VSTGRNDSGVFELNFREEPYIPFEGAGPNQQMEDRAPVKFREFDYDSITDLVMHLRYTTLDGGDKLKRIAENWVNKVYVKSTEDLSQNDGCEMTFRTNGTRRPTRPPERRSGS